uniref:Coat protein n=1 Tax=Buxbaumia ophiovirus TaxID=2983932 RepID=A0A9N6YK60_9VIRU|nr:TPA_asm: coat protein [Buxbaumia ophiovirus]
MDSGKDYAERMRLQAQQEQEKAEAQRAEAEQRKKDHDEFEKLKDRAWASGDTDVLQTTLASVQVPAGTTYVETSTGILEPKYPGPPKIERNKPDPNEAVLKLREWYDSQSKLKGKGLMGPSTSSFVPIPQAAPIDPNPLEGLEQWEVLDAVNAISDTPDEDISRVFSEQPVSINQSLIASMFLFFASTIGSLYDYMPRSVLIFYTYGSKVTLNSIIGSGTKVLDAILFCSLREDEERSQIFNLTILPKAPSSVDINANLKTAKRSFMSMIVHWYCTGSAPVGTGSTNKFIKDVLLESKTNSIQDLAGTLSSTGISAFPIDVVASIPFSSLPYEVRGRCVLGLAGTRFLKYYQLSRNYSRSHVGLCPAGSSKKDADDIFSRASMVEHAFASAVEGGMSYMSLHPSQQLPQKRCVGQKFQLRCCQFILLTVIPGDRDKFLKTLRMVPAHEKDESFKGDPPACLQVSNDWKPLSQIPWNQCMTGLLQQ